MKNLKIKSIKAKNFLSFGTEGVEINFEELGNIVLIKGKNLDYFVESDNFSSNKNSSNGSGKSSIQEIICYALYGKTIKNPKKLSKNDVINNLTKKGCCVEIVFDEYKISRGRSPDFLRLWKNKNGEWNKDSELTQGKQQDTQDKIDSIVGINYDVFISTCVFSDDQNNCFLESDLASKRSIIENLLSLDVYRDRFELSKSLLRDNKNLLKQLVSEYEIFDSNKINLKNRLESTLKSEYNWKLSKKNEITKIINQVKDKKHNLSLIKEDVELTEYENSKKKLIEVNKKIDDTTSDIEELQNKIKPIQDKVKSIKESIDKKIIKKSDLEKSIKDLKNSIQNNLKEIESHSKKTEGKKCEYCFSTIDPNNFKNIIQKYELENDLFKKDLDILLDNLKNLNVDIDKDKDKYNKNEIEFKNLETQINQKNSLYKQLREHHKNYSSIKEPNSKVKKSILEKEIEVLKLKAKELKDEYDSPSPYFEVLSGIDKDIKDLDEKIKDKKDQIESIEKDLPYIDFWVEAFGDSGIRKWVVDSIIPSLNNKLKYFMFILDNNRLNIEFNNELEEKIYKKVEEENILFNYHTLSAGQKRRLNLAVSQSFAHIMLNNVCSCPSVVFLDEVTTNIDPVGVLGIYNLICELSEERQVFITTHDNDLLSLLDGCDTIDLEMKKGISTLKVKNKNLVNI